MEIAWCCACHDKVPLAYAVIDRPCPKCGGLKYLFAVGDRGRDALLAEAERMMRLGLWDRACAIYDHCGSTGLMSRADRNLSVTLVDWRRSCAERAKTLVEDAGGSVSAGSAKELLSAEFNEQAVAWLFKDFVGLRLARRDSGRFVEVVEDD